MLKKLSIVVPVFNEEDSLESFVRVLQPVIKKLETSAQHPMDTEVIFVNDGSNDQTQRYLLELDAPFAISVIKFSRNFGKEAALTAGLKEATGDCVVIIDVDLQDPPDLIIEMVSHWQKGAKVVLARRVDRSEDSYLKRMTAGLFYRLHNVISEVQIPYNVGDFRLMDASVVEAINSLPENRKFMKGLFAWVGFEPVFVEYSRDARHTGKSKFSGWKLWRFAVEGITSFSDLPLVMWTYVGSVISLTAFFYAGFVVFRTMVWGIDVPGYASLLVGILFLGGIQIVGIGILGEYLGRVYSEVKRRPPYIIESRTQNNCDKDNRKADDA